MTTPGIKSEKVMYLPNDGKSCLYERFKHFIDEAGAPNDNSSLRVQVVGTVLIDISPKKVRLASTNSFLDPVLPSDV